MWNQGQVLQSGRYEITRRLGGGGFGLTYLATDSFFNRKVVIKTPNSTFQADQDYERYLRRFQREGQTLASIEHPNIVKVYGFFEEENVPCLVMAYVKGETLQERVRNQGVLSENEAVQTFRKLAAALHELHQAGMFHCDVHPGNVVLQQSGEPVLIDFGSAKNLTPATVTITATVNQGFSPYEQQNPNSPPKATLDVYSLAATLYFAVTGTKPIAAVNRKLYGDTLALPQSYQPDLNSWLCEAILRGLSLEPQDRPQTMQSWLEILRPPIPPKVEVNDDQPLEAEETSEVSVEEANRHNKLTSISSQPSQDIEQTSEQKTTITPYIPLSIFLASNIPTGAGLWILGKFDASPVSGRGYVFIGIVHSIVAVVVFRIVAGKSKNSRILASWATSGWVVATMCLATDAYTLQETEEIGALGITFVAPAVVVTITATIAVIGSIFNVLLQLVRRNSQVRATKGLVTTLLSGTRLGAVVGVWFTAVAFAFIRIEALPDALGATTLGVVISIMGAAGYTAHQDKEYAYWVRIGISTSALAGSMVCLLSTNLPLMPVLFFLSFISVVQMDFISRSLRAITPHFSRLRRSALALLAVVSATCAVGMTGGAVLAWILFRFGLFQ